MNDEDFDALDEDDFDDFDEELEEPYLEDHRYIV